jgi:hypothetical protein
LGRTPGTNRLSKGWPEVTYDGITLEGIGQFKMSDPQRNDLLRRRKSEQINTEWGPSPVEIWKSLKNPQWEGDISNFRLLKISSGTINPPDRPRNISQEPYPDENFFYRVINSLLLVVFLVRLEVHSLLITQRLFGYVSEPSSKKFRKLSVPNNFFTEIAMRMSYYSHRIKKLNQKQPVIMEIGAGYGALSSYLAGCYSKYIIVDLIENLILASEFLKEAGISFGTISDFTNDDVSVLLLTGGDIQKLQKVDIVINTMSMQHMSSRNLTYYFGHIERLDPEFIYLVNRNIKRDPTDTEIQNYPIPSSYIIRKTATIYSRNYSEMLFVRKKYKQTRFTGSD